VSVRLQTVVAGLVLASVLGVLAHRAVTRVNLPGRPTPDRWVLQDFRDAVYYPAVAFAHGGNPYDQEEQARAYPVGQSFPPYLPLTLVVHLPLGFLPHAEAGAVYFVATIVLTAVLAALAIGGAGVRVTSAGVLALTALLVASRPGQMNLLLGQVTAQVVIGAYVALRWARTRPLLAGLGLALATLKPTCGMPLAALMLFGRGDVLAVAVGAAVSAALCLLALVPLVHAADGVLPFVASLGSSVAAFSAEGTSNAWSSFARLDAVSLLARVMGRVPDGWMELGLGLAIVGAGVAGLRRLRGDHSAPTVQVGVGLICLTVLVATYHQAYDALLVAQPAVALGAGRWGRGAVAPPALRWIALALLALPAVNYLATSTVASRLIVGSPAWLAITAASPLALLAAWAVHLGIACRRHAHCSTSQPVPSSSLPDLCATS
jgi:hypothetical protein